MPCWGRSPSKVSKTAVVSRLVPAAWVFPLPWRVCSLPHRSGKENPSVVARLGRNRLHGKDCRRMKRYGRERANYLVARTVFPGTGSETRPDAAGRRPEPKKELPMNAVAEDYAGDRPCLILAHADPAYAAQVLRTFRRQGWDVYTAQSGPEVRRLARMLEPQLVVHPGRPARGERLAHLRQIDAAKVRRSRSSSSPPTRRRATPPSPRSSAPPPWSTAGTAWPRCCPASASPSRPCRRSADGEDVIQRRTRRRCRSVALPPRFVSILCGGARHGTTHPAPSRGGAGRRGLHGRRRLGRSRPLRRSPSGV